MRWLVHSKKLFCLFLTTAPRYQFFNPKFQYRNMSSSTNFFNFNSDGSKNTNYVNQFLVQNQTGLALDVNCGTGETTMNLSYRYPELKIYGIDKNPHYIELAKKRYSDYGFVNLNFECYTGIPARTFQVVQISDYEDLLLTYQKGILLLQNNGLLIYHCQSKSDLYELRKYLSDNEHSLFTSSFHQNISHYVNGFTVYIFK